MDHYRVYGNPIKQSKSPIIHLAFAKQTNQALNYQSELVPVDNFKDVVSQFIATGGKGANVTLPFKEQAMQMCDHLTARAKLAGAVNTLSFKNGEICGDNTDGVGLVNDIKEHGVAIKNKRILLLGAGGAAKGVILPLLDENPDGITIANRTVSKAQNLIVQFDNQRLNACGFNEVGEQPFDIIINATSASLSGEMPSLPDTIVGNSTVCYDMVYGNSLTTFLMWAKKNNAHQIIDGLGMLVGQAAESFYIWRGVRPETSEVMSSLRKAIKE